MLQSLSSLRVNKKFSQAELAKVVGVSQQAVSQWENKQKTPKAIYVRKLARALGVSTDVILDSIDS